MLPSHVTTERAELVAYLRQHPALNQPLVTHLKRWATGLPILDDFLGGGLPRGAVTELVGRRSSGRTSLALAALGAATARSEVVAWIDPEDALDPLSVQAAGICLDRFLWVRPTGNDRFRQALQAADMVIGAGGFAAVVLDVAAGLGRKALARTSCWVRLSRRLETAGTVLLVLAHQEVAAASAYLRLACLQGRGGSVRIEITRFRGGAIGGFTTLRLGEVADW